MTTNFRPVTAAPREEPDQWQLFEESEEDNIESKCYSDMRGTKRMKVKIRRKI